MVVEPAGALIHFEKVEIEVSSDPGPVKSRDKSPPALSNVQRSIWSLLQFIPTSFPLTLRKNQQDLQKQLPEHKDRLLDKKPCAVILQVHKKILIEKVNEVVCRFVIGKNEDSMT